MTCAYGGLKLEDVRAQNGLDNPHTIGNKNKNE